MRYIKYKFCDFFRYMKQDFSFRKSKVLFELKGVHNEEFLIIDNHKDFFIEHVEKEYSKWILIEFIDYKLNLWAYVDEDEFVYNNKLTLNTIKKIILNYY
jgi:hypothetical protein